MALGGLAPLMSGEAFAAGAGEAVLGETGANVFSGLTGAVGALGTAMDPEAEHGFGPSGEGEDCGSQ
jgi:hypothetical protein